MISQMPNRLRVRQGRPFRGPEVANIGREWPCSHSRSIYEERFSSPNVDAFWICICVFTKKARRPTFNYLKLPISAGELKHFDAASRRNGFLVNLYKKVNR